MSDFSDQRTWMGSSAMRFEPHDALIIVDLQRDFCSGGALPIADAEGILPEVNKLIEQATAAGACVVASRDWHPRRHVSFRGAGGRWPQHCVRESEGAGFHEDLRLPSDAMIVSKGETRECEQYSAFDNTSLAARLHDLGVRRVVIVGLAQDVCVRATALDALAAGFETHVRLSATRPVTPEGGAAAAAALRRAGVILDEG